jgi:peptidoglycan hydrolase FlgJ
MTTPLTPAAGANTYTDVNGLESLKRDLNSPQALSGVAKQVEAMFLQMMLKSMRDASFGDALFDSNEGQMYQDMFDKQIALDMSQHQDVGIGALLLRQLSQKSAPEPGAAPIADLADPLAPTMGTVPARSGVTAGALTPAQFVAQILPSIQRAAAKLGVDPNALLAQAALESGWGLRVAKSADGRSSFNLFGVKANEAWKGRRVISDTIEFDGSSAKRQRAAFRAYDSIDDSVQDFAAVLTASPRYQEALTVGVNASAYAQAMGTSGYATDPDYGNKLKQILSSDTLRSALAPRLSGLQK